MRARRSDSQVPRPCPELALVEKGFGDCLTGGAFEVEMADTGGGTDRTEDGIEGRLRAKALPRTCLLSLLRGLVSGGCQTLLGASD